MRRKNKFKRGAASFYIVAFSTLILMVVAISFAAVIIAEMERTSNDDLSQSAYDSALAGIEDAKLAYYDYQNCKMSVGDGGELKDRCEKIVQMMEKQYTVEGTGQTDEEKCSMIWEILDRGQGNQIVESNTGNNMQQYTTCVTMNDLLPDYKGSLNSGSPMDVVKVKFELVNGFKYDNITKVRLKWYSTEDATRDYPDSNNDTLSFGNYRSSSGVGFPAAPIPVSTPPTVYLAMIQTGLSFDMSSFYKVENGKTNRGMLYLVPSATRPSAGKAHNYNVATSADGVTNLIGADAMVKSNDKTVENLPYVVQCTKDASDVEEYACSVDINLPKPVGGGERSSETFRFVVGLPYGQPQTDFSLEFLCNDRSCGRNATVDLSGAAAGESQAMLKGVQLEVDSTGRANDLYRRVVARLKNQTNSFSVMGPLELLDNYSEESDSQSGLIKDMVVTCEMNFGDSNC